MVIELEPQSDGICPACGYRRKPTDTAPQWQCPACEVVYSKFSQPVEEKPRPGADTPRTELPDHKWKLVVFVLVIGAIYLMLHAKRSEDADFSAPVIYSENMGEVLMYTTSWCGMCQKARDFFDKHEIPYTEHDVEADREAYQDYRALGGRGVPLIFIGQTRIEGFDEAEIRKALSERVQVRA